MPKVLIHSFNISLAKPKRVIKEPKNYTVTGRKLTAVVIEDEGILKARINTSPVEDIDTITPEFLVLPFTEDSFELKGKLEVFAKHKDEYGHRIMVIRDPRVANISPGVPHQYDALQEGLRIEGHICTKGHEKYFRYENLVANTEEGIAIGEPIFKSVTKNGHKNDKSS